MSLNLKQVAVDTLISFSTNDRTRKMLVRVAEEVAERTGAQPGCLVCKHDIDADRWAKGYVSVGGDIGMCALICHECADPIMDDDKLMWTVIGQAFAEDQGMTIVSGGGYDIHQPGQA